MLNSNENPLQNLVSNARDQAQNTVNIESTSEHVQGDFAASSHESELGRDRSLRQRV